MDLGSGDERYKRSWCDEKQDLFDVILAAGPLGVPFAEMEKLGYHLRRAMRRSPLMWDTITHLRRARARLLWR